MKMPSELRQTAEKKSRERAHLRANDHSVSGTFVSWVDVISGASGCAGCQHSVMHQCCCCWLACCALGKPLPSFCTSVGLASIGVSKCGGFMNLWSCGCLKAHVQALKITASKTRMVIRERLEGSSASAFAFSTSRV